MNYIENIFVCLALPLVLAVLCTERKRRASILFLLAGMTTCLISSYISSFFAEIRQADAKSAAIEITPMVEECLKLLPVLFGLLVFELDAREASNSILMTAVGFATFENVCYLSANSASDLTRLLIRGASTGAMHIVCGYLVGVGLLALWKNIRLKAPGTVALLCLVMLYHSIYNLLVSQTGAAAVVGYVLPLVTLIPAIILTHRLLTTNKSGKTTD